MSPTKIIHHRGVQPPRNLLRPRPQLPEVARAQEVDVEGVLAGGAGAREDAEGVAGFACAVALLVDEVDLLGDGGGVHDGVEILNADLATGAEGVGGVVGPAGGVNAPAAVVVGVL